MGEGTFNCLWCGRPHTPRSPADLEVYARLCPDCVGRAQDNEFLRFRLREGLRQRAAANQPAVAQSPAGGAGEPPAIDEELRRYYASIVDEYDDWYVRRGRYSRGPITDMAFQAELDAATMWLDGLEIGGEIVELAAGTGWWSPLLAQKGELSIYDVVEEVLDKARERLLAHGLRAHIHLRDAWQQPDRQVDALFTGFWLVHVPSERLADFFAIARSWLKPGGTYAFIDRLPGEELGPVDESPSEPGVAQSPAADGRALTDRFVLRPPAEFEVALLSAGFSEVEVRPTGRFFVLGRAVA